MTAAEKAKDLVGRFTATTHPVAVIMTDGKQCALIAVDEILEATKEPVLPMGGVTGFDYHTYWLEVKTEIEKL